MEEQRQHNNNATLLSRRNTALINFPSANNSCQTDTKLSANVRRRANVPLSMPPFSLSPAPAAPSHFLYLGLLSSPGARVIPTEEERQSKTDFWRRVRETCFEKQSIYYRSSRGMGRMGKGQSSVGGCKDQTRPSSGWRRRWWEYRRQGEKCTHTHRMSRWCEIEDDTVGVVCCASVALLLCHCTQFARRASPSHVSHKWIRLRDARAASQSSSSEKFSQIRSVYARGPEEQKTCFLYVVRQEGVHCMTTLSTHLDVHKIFYAGFLRR